MVGVHSVLKTIGWWAGLTGAACAAPVSFDPGDAQSMAWRQPRWECPVDRPVIDCKGGSRRSLTVGQACTVVRSCVIHGSLRVQGNYSSTNYIDSEWSRSGQYVEEIRAQAPMWIEIRDVTVVGHGMLPIYVATGVTGVLFKNVQVVGESNAAAIYLESESGYNRFIDVVVDVDVPDGYPAVAIDGSDHNRFIGLIVKDGGVYFYRNCGEGGVTRVTTPSSNFIGGSWIIDDVVPIWFGSRLGDRSYCHLDNGGTIGSSLSDLSFARFNLVVDTMIEPKVVLEMSGSWGNNYDSIR